ncbi:hypothetical protein PORY_001202 [Pneumocystis oryctolagi]|uniref:Uncharacterized protein n=1 Tax=Pneumocystis oryctolagi TaxID=42067 RepID=A0ACB7CDC8_9ASCO|nr:hypothetical protein PORY_001202 [Pneumocystis oryctolagi]
MSNTTLVKDTLHRSDSYESCYNRSFLNLNGNQTLQEDGSSSISEIFLRRKNRSFLSSNGFTDCSSALFSIYAHLGDEPETPKTFLEQKTEKKTHSHSMLPITRFWVFLAKVTVLYAWGYSISIFVFHVQTKENATSSYKFKILTHIPHFSIFYGLGTVLFGLLIPITDSITLKLRCIPSKDVLHNESRKSKCMEISETIRILSTFMGIVYAFAKLSWVLDIKTSLFLAFIGFFMWFIFDRAQTGLFLSGIISILFTMIILSFPSDIFENNDSMSKEIISIKSWILGFLFSSCITAGNIGRRLFRHI